eukprot:1152351-Pelagomonas_calceolata.AAC.4
MSRSYDVPDDLDESDLMAELDGLESDMTFGETEAGGAPSYLQVSPDHKPNCLPPLFDIHSPTHLLSC